MKKTKIALASLLIVGMSMSFFGCGSEEESSSYKEMDSAVRDSVNDVVNSEELLTGELENKTIKWLSDWDINPDASGKSTPIELAMFQERYGGVIEYHQTTWATRYDDLANAINSDEGIDFFYAGNFDAFPKGAIRGMFVPADDYIDFSSPLWEGVKEVNDSITWNGSHYMVVVQMTGDNCAVIYNRDTIQELGFDDPAELYAEGEWTWDIFHEMLQEFVDVDNGKYGLDGWWFEAGLSATTGVPYIGLEDGKLVSNLTDPSIERVQNFLYDLYNTNSIAIGVGDYGWTEHPEYIGEGKTLFYPCGLWAIYSEPEQWKGKFGENCFFVPMPKDPEADEYYIPANMDSYVFVKGGHNPEGVAKYLDCKRASLMNEEAKAIGNQAFIDDYAWTQEMIDMKNTMDEMALENPVINFMNGVSTDLSDIIDSGTRGASRGTPWNETLGTIKDAVQTMVDEANNS